MEEICRGIEAVSGLCAAAARPGWIVVECRSAGMARWLADAIQDENVAARAEQAKLLLPAGDYFTLKGEIKNVITATAKTTHYWGKHVPAEAKRALDLQAQLTRLRACVLGWVGWRAG
jgi:sirohydrochlorin cobaltochelatase